MADEGFDPERIFTSYHLHSDTPEWSERHIFIHGGQRSSWCSVVGCKIRTIN
jgi:hypothetical protein